MSFDENMIFKPIIPLSIMIPFTVILGIIVLINRKHVITRILILLLLLYVSQRPMLRDEDDVAYVSNLDVIFVVDTTVSMNAYNEKNVTRLDEVKKTIDYIMEELKGSKYSVITYNNDAYVKYPFTNDSAIIKKVVEGLKIIEPNYAVGSSLSKPAGFLEMLLESSMNSDEAHEEKRSRIVFFMGDGELNNQEKMKTNYEEYNNLKDKINSGAVIGFGTTEGQKIKIMSSIRMEKLVDSSGNLLDNSVNPPVAAISKLNEDNLKLVADKLGVEYFKINSEKLDKKLEEIKNIKSEDEDDDAKNDKDLYYFLTFISLILMLYELFYYRRNEL